ncbi:MAG: GNAT family N-acetyltransferase, partial [Anaerolineaceae bacterium]|nr:GNAT family N-acetyltransferase [Anaerolineaceae bacterium]
RREKETFLTFPWQLYAGDPNWVPPMLPELRERIDPRRGAWFQRGMAEFFLVYDGDDVVGRFSIGIDEKANEDSQKKEAVFGFFEVIENYTIAETIFDFLRDWAIDHGMDSLYGPFHLDYENAYGVLVEGFDCPPVMLCGHTPPYYLDYFERYGFEPGRPDNIALRMTLDEETEALRKLRHVAMQIRARDTYSIRSADFDHWEDEVDVLHKLLNRSLTHLEGHIPWQREAVAALVEQFRTIADPEMILFVVENASGETIGFFPGTPNMNEHFKAANGLRHWWNYPRFLMNYRSPTECLTIKSVLVLPEHWGSGAAMLLFDEMVQRVRAHQVHRWIDLSLTSIDNPQTPRLAQRMGAEIYKRYRVFRLIV